MSGESNSNLFSSAVSEYSAPADAPTKSKPRPLSANKKGDHPQAENRKPSFNSSWQPKSSRDMKPAPSPNWRVKNQPRNASSALSSWRREEPNGPFRLNDAFVRQTSGTNPFGERRNKFGSSFSPVSGFDSTTLPARKAFVDSRNKFGSNLSISSDRFGPSRQSGVGRKPFRDSREKFGSGWSVSSESLVRGRGLNRGASYARGNAAGRKQRTVWPEKSIRQRAAGVDPESIEYLNILSQKKVHEIVVEVTIDKSPFDAFLQKSPLESDQLLLILSIVAKICVSDFEGNCSEILYKLCKSQFLHNLSKYLGQMTMETNPETLKKFPAGDLCELYSSLLDAWDVVAVEKNLKMLINKTKIAVNNIPVILGVPIDEDIVWKLEKCIDTFDEYKKMLEEKWLIEKRKRSNVEKMAICAPPNDFRRLSLYPTVDDIFRNELGFVRPNLIKGAYEDVEHYLDVQFRLLREDFIDSVRSGVQKYLASKSEPRKKFRFDSIRIYPETTLLSWEQRSSGSQKVGIRLNFDPHGKFARTCDWVQNKRFMYGSLLLLTANDFSNVTCATVLERDVPTLRNGCVLAALVEETPDFHKVFAKPFIMAEVEVFFEPYSLILQALKKLDDHSFPLTDYIVRGQSKTKSPSYPAEDIDRVDDTVWKFGLNVKSRTVPDDERKIGNEFELDPYQMKAYDAGMERDSAPDNESEISNEFELDSYQVEAYEAGMERDFCIIQGPPGTGKTFLGLKLVESILKECHDNGYKLPILVVCLTNHALDQFLERILAFTIKIVRVGGQSQNENLDSRNLRALRGALSPRHFGSMTFTIKKEIELLGKTIEKMQEMKKYIETPVGVLSTILLKQVVHPNFVSVVKNDKTLLKWLLEDIECEARMEDEVVDFDHLYENGAVDCENVEPVKAKKREEKTSINLTSIFQVNCLKSYSITQNELEERFRKATEQYEDLIQNEEQLLERGCDSSLIYLEKSFLKHRMKLLNRRCHKLKANLETYVKKPDAKVLTALHLDPAELSSKERWLLYWSWLSNVQQKLLSELSELETRHRAKTIQYDEYKMFEDLDIIKQADVVGMTTTGAARLNRLLGLLQPAIVIVEEAAEVLEAHIVASLTNSCQHLILIGDHKQLKPTAAVYELSKHYNIDVSLFERMINNGMHCPMLKVQHRMRPEISALITPLIYPDLENHESVTLLEPVEGVEKNVFFLKHNMPETVAYDETSKENVHEAEFVVKLAKYFIQQGYSPEHITLLTFYAGQMFRIRNLLKDDGLKDVNCVVVDKYQGEENSIIILSLVRSNEEGNIGFLSIENRVCVALSRAKNGLFMIGNMDCLAKSRLWQKLNNVLKQYDEIGEALPLYCDRHHKITLVSKAEDFHLVSDGGCGAVCNLEMGCGHYCKRMCHPLLEEHPFDNCTEPCLKFCPRNHRCKKRCNEDCGKCFATTEKILPCQHVARVRCHVAEKYVLCTKLVEDVLLSCNHIVKRKCHQSLEDVNCTKPCRKILSCGHTCSRLCHEEDDPDHIKCKNPCEKYYKGCKKAHLCGRLCYEECDRCPFKENINLSCGHEFSARCSMDLNSVKCRNPCLKICPQCNLNCSKQCWEDCHPCVNKVRKVIPACGHEIDVKCSDEPDKKLCQQNCQLMAPCGHKCQFKCGETCSSKGCKEWMTSTTKKPVCGHQKIYVLCSEKEEVLRKEPETFLANCQEKCNTILECGHVCTGTCGECFQGRLHQTCPKLCGRTFICGHSCKFPCSKLCPPCNEPCSFSCSHSKCPEKCGIPCSTCKEPCEWKCKHSKCTRKCGEICNRQPCNKPCELKLNCGHDCMGFCGEPCPQQCRICNPEIANNAPDARYVLMVDCGHIIESRVLDQYFSLTFKNGEIALRGCPTCGTLINKTLRYMDFVKRTQLQISDVKKKNFDDLRSYDLENIFLKWRKLPSECSKVQSFFNFAKFCIENIPDSSKKHTIFPSEMLSTYIYFFQLCLTLISRAQEFSATLMTNAFSRRVLLYFDKLVRRLQTSFNVNRQLMLDFNSELRRYHLMVDYQYIHPILAARLIRGDAEIPKICAEIEEMLLRFTKFTQDDEDKFRGLFEKLRTRPSIASGSSWPKKKLAAIKQLPRIFVDLKAGCWFQCFNGHYYCIDQEEKKTDCSECVKKGILVAKQSGRRRRRGRR